VVDWGEKLALTHIQLENYPMHMQHYLKQRHRWEAALWLLFFVVQVGSNITVA